MELLEFRARRVAIVGSEEKYWTPEQKAKVILLIEETLVQNCIWLENEFTTLDDAEEDIEIDPTSAILISGGCPKGGVDIWAELVAKNLGIKTEIYKPEVNQWEDKIVEYRDSERRYKVKQMGYKSRNFEIAKACDVLYCFDPKFRGARTGGQYTLRCARKLGREVHLIEIK